MTNTFGPDPTRGGVTVRPPISTPANATEHWFNTCSSPSDPAQTKVTTDFLNNILGVLRRLISTSGAAQSEVQASSDDMAAEAMARVASGAIYGVDSGTANTHVVASPLTFIGPKSYFDGMMVVYDPANTNTASTTCAAFGLTAKVIRTFKGATLVAGDIVAGRTVCLRYVAADGGGAGGWRLMPWAMVSSGLSFANQRQIYTTPGTVNFTVPAGVTVLRAEVWGGGGGGGGGKATLHGGGGGAGSGYSYKRIAVTPGEVIAITVGAGGAVSTAGAAGNAGGASSVGAYVSVPGAVGGNAATGSLPGAGSADGSVGTGGDVNLKGGRGGQGHYGNPPGHGGSGGGAARGGPGGATRSGAGDPGTSPGGGGSGGGSNSASDTQGNAGANGMVILEWNE